MDLELEQDIILCYETVGQATACQEETLEAIVPDACPDILQIVQVNAQAFPSRWEARDGQAAVIGSIHATVLYIPEEGHMIRKMDLTIPFTVQLELSAMTADCTLEVATRLRSADGRILNPRKILFRGDLVTEFTAFRKKDYPICSGAYQADNEKLCQRQTQLEHEHLVCIPQRIFPMSEEIRLAGTQVPEILSCRGESTCTESKVIGSKLIFKGKTDITLLIQAEDGTLERRSESFPFSQILEAKGSGDATSGTVHLELAELVCRSSADDPFRLMLDMEILAQGQVRNRTTSILLTDLYSTTHHTELEQQMLTLYAPGEEQVQTQTLRDLLETDDVVRSVCDSRFHLGPILRSQDDGTLCLKAQGQISVLYLDENQQLQQLIKSVELSAHVNAPQGSLVNCQCRCPGELFATPCAGGIEVRLNLEFCTTTAVPIHMEMVHQAKLGEARCSEGRRPSVVLRMPEPGESLWEIAKSCGTTKSRIIQANELTGEDIPHNQMLLIPNVR